MLSAILINITLPFSNIGQDILDYLASRLAGYGGNPGDRPHLSRSCLETKASSDVFRDLYNRAFMSMNNLHAFTLCISNGVRKAPPFFFQETFSSLMKLPTIDLHLTHPEFMLPYFSYLSQFCNI
ncbi:hypothetical protein F5146DRAFT_1147322 [Armillaria mellea]|nr:hypothetical protein F5146DRAFT_1147322 [Armillaria mellea]